MEYLNQFPTSLILVLGLTTLIYVLRTYQRLAHIPGPFWARLTNVPRATWVLSNSAHAKHIHLHRQYGQIVRLGPNMVSVQDPKEIKHIYDTAGTFPKSNFYRALLLYAKGNPVPTIFATQDESLHRTLRRPIAGLYSMTNVAAFEANVDQALDTLHRQLHDRFVETKMPCDLGQWLQWLAFDVMGEMTFSKRLGFLDEGKDIGNVTANIRQYFRQQSPISQITWLDWVFSKNPIAQRLFPAQTNPVVAFGLARAQQRSEAVSGTRENDFLSRFMAAIAKDSSIPPFALMAWTTSNVTAGSDTTAILLRTIFHELLINPECMRRLIAEIDAAFANGSLTDEVAFRDSRKLPYLDAVIKESSRVHPPFGLHFERVVPEGGAIICGKHVKAGTIVGMNPWVVHQHAETFGQDCDAWRPQRWLDCDEEKKRAMDNAILTFGAGARVCLGKNVALFEVYKIVPSLLRKFTVSLPVAGVTVGPLPYSLSPSLTTSAVSPSRSG